MPLPGGPGAYVANGSDHDPTDLEAAYDMVRTKGVPQGVVYKRPDPVPLEIMWEESSRKSNPATVQDLMTRYKV